MGFQKIIPYKNPRDGAGGATGTSRSIGIDRACYNESDWLIPGGGERMG